MDIVLTPEGKTRVICFTCEYLARSPSCVAPQSAPQVAPHARFRMFAPHALDMTAADAAVAAAAAAAALPALVASRYVDEARLPELAKKQSFPLLS